MIFAIFRAIRCLARAVKFCMMGVGLVHGARRYVL